MKPSWAITGRSAHAAEQANYEQKLESHADMPLNDVRDIAADTFERELATGKEEVIWGKDEQPGDAKDRVVQGVTTYHMDIAPKVQPIMVEEAVDLVLPWGTRVTGRMDVVDQNVSIRDTKHVSMNPHDGDDQYQTQPGLYGWMYKEMTGDIPHFTFDYVILGRKGSTKAKPTARSVETPVNDARIQASLNRIKAVDAQIRSALKSGDVAANPNPFNCAGCGYKKLCPYAYRGV